MTGHTRRLRHPDDARSPSWRLPLEPGLSGARYPLYVRPKIPFSVDEGWFDAQSHKDRPGPSPRLLSQAFQFLKSGTEVLREAVGRLARRVSTRRGAEVGVLADHLLWPAIDPDRRRP